MDEFNPPSPLSAAWTTWYEQVLASRFVSSPRERTRTFYFSQAGNDATGNGSMSQPYRTLAKARSILAANPAGDIALLFRRGEVWRETTGLVIDRNVTVADYGDINLPKPLFTVFQPIDPAQWQPVEGAPGVFARPEPTTVVWVKQDDNLDEPLWRMASFRSVATRPGSWFWNGSTLFVNPKPGANGIVADPRTSGQPWQLARPSGAGFIVFGDGSRLENLVAIGWGMGTSSPTQQHGIESRAAASSRTLIVGCESYYGSSHVMTHAASGATGGVATFVGCKAGLTNFNGSPGETIFNTYSLGGGQRVIFESCVATHGTLPSAEWAASGTLRRGIAMYGHSGAAAGQEIGMVISRRLTTRDTRWGASAGAFFSDLPVAATIEQSRGLIVDEVFEGGEGTGTAFYLFMPSQARINGRYLNIRFPALADTVLQPFRSGGWMVNGTVDLDMANLTSLSLVRTSMAGSNPALWNSWINVRNNGSGASFMTDAFSNSTGASVVNSVFTSSGGGAARNTFGGPNGPSISSAFFGFWPSGASIGGQWLTSAPTVDVRPSCSSGLTCVGVAPLPTASALQFDQRRVVAMRRSLGPLDSTPCANCDGSTTQPVLGPTDLSCFLARYRAGDVWANCDGSTRQPVLGPTDFSCFLARYRAGCA